MSYSVAADTISWGCIASFGYRENADAKSGFGDDRGWWILAVSVWRSTSCMAHDARRIGRKVSFRSTTRWVIPMKSGWSNSASLKIVLYEAAYLSAISSMRRHCWISLKRLSFIDIMKLIIKMGYSIFGIPRQYCNYGWCLRRNDFVFWMVDIYVLEAGYIYW